ncbi:hypothetical protein [Streptomyces sp. NRRL S-340]|uniref:hypothetical protein n=1 Tax=Streptomyces sp. NRRL S-340 TaxID=1463901 RepID=UPI00056AD6A7|nr:hypothetical protein [Streptomyces sp. NRRL S-340]
MNRIARLAGREPLGLDSDWGTVEQEIGAPLPADFKQLVDTFGMGVFGEYLYPLGDTAGEFSVSGNLSMLRRTLSRHPDATGVYRPYAVFEPGRVGLLSWAQSTAEEAEFYWLARDGEDPDRWPIVARVDPTGDWHRFEMPVSAFVFRMLTDDSVHPFGVPTGPGLPPFRAW